MGRRQCARVSCYSWTYPWALFTPAPSGRERVSALVSCLSGQALELAHEVWGEGDAALDQKEMRCWTSHLRQGTRSAQEFAMDFRTLASGAGWNDRALINHYHCSLREDVRRELACRDTTFTFDQLVDLSIRLDNLLATRGRPDRVRSAPSPSTAAPVPMELGSIVRRENGGVSG